MGTNPAPGGLAQFVANWQARTPGVMHAWPREWPILELIFTLVTWIPSLQNDPEGQVYLEAITRTVSEVGQFAGYRAHVRHGDGVHDQNSIANAIREIFSSIAEGDVDVDEEIMPHVPRNYFPMMTIHQAKGLEFPLVVVDVGSDFRQNHQAQARNRFPTSGDEVHTVEDALTALSPVGAARAARTAVDRAWDDLRRLYYVSFSRAENVLLLAGLTSQMGQNPRVRSVATGDIRATNVRQFQFVPAAQWQANMPDNTVALI
jgi:DNA helicase-2/ATP-dependent DNA helicase PcrA